MKIVVAMSGGVDSSVVAKILKDEGNEVVGLFLKLWSDPVCKIEKDNRCCNYEALEDARKVASKLNIPFYVINARDEFKKSVVDYFLDEYKNFRTPNPCVVCNQKIKFGLLLNRAMSIGCDKLATGHYARIKKIQDTRYKLQTGIDKTKDQSYMLYHLNQDQLSKIAFPLGKMRKAEVRALAVKYNLPVCEKPESQEICFVGERDYRIFLKRYLSDKYFRVGEIVNIKGDVLGKHAGLVNYTIGQRKGIADVVGGKPLYVIGFDEQKNQLIVGGDKEVYQKNMIVGDMHWINPNKKIPADISVKIRYRHPAVGCQIDLFKNVAMKQCSNLRVVFDEPQRAITPGQSAVFYHNDEVLGGGVIV